MIEGEIARLSTAATSARRDSALGGLEGCLGRFVRLDRPEEEGKDEDASLLRSGGKPVDAGLSRVGFALVSLAWLLAPKAMKSPGGAWPEKHQRNRTEN